MNLLYKIIVSVVLILPVIMIYGRSLPFLSKRIEKELTENGEEFSAPENPKRVYLIFYVIVAALFILSASLSGDSLDFQPLLRLFSILFLITLLSLISTLDIIYYVIPNGLTLIIFAYSAIVSLIVPLVSGVTVFAGMLECGIGFLVGGLSLLLINVISVLVLKRDGIGGGDIKLMFAVGLLLGWKLTVFALLFGFIVGSVCSVILRLASKPEEGRSVEIPFGPYLSLGAVVAALFGNQVISWYLTAVGIG